MFGNYIAPPPAYHDDDESKSSTEKQFKIGDKVFTIPVELEGDCLALKDELGALGMENHEARVAVVLDISGSMEDPNGFYTGINSSKVQRVLNKSLAMGFLFDDDKQIEVFPFGDTVYPPIKITRENFTKATQLVLESAGGFKGYTNYCDAIQGIRSHFFKFDEELHTPQPCSKPPLFLLFITDGEPNLKKSEAELQFISASHQAVFIKIIALRGKQADQQFKYLVDLDNHKNKQTDLDSPTGHSSFFIDNIDRVILDSPEQLNMKMLINEYRPWLLEARKRKLLTLDPKIVLKPGEEEGRIVRAITPQAITLSVPGSGMGVFESKQHERKAKEEQAKNAASTDAQKSGCSCVIL